MIGTTGTTTAMMTAVTTGITTIVTMIVTRIEVDPTTEVRLPPWETKGAFFMRAFAAFVSVSLIGLSTAAGAAETCDRACLSGLMTQYIDALVAHDPSKLPLADRAPRSPRTPRTIKLGEGIWKTATAKGAFRQDYLDMRKQVAAAHFVVLEGTNQALCSVLLHVKDGKIAGIESLIRARHPGIALPAQGTGRAHQGA